MKDQAKDIPSGWKETTLGEVAELIKEQWLPGDKGEKYIGLEHINQGTLTINGCGHSSKLESNKYYFGMGDVLFGKLRPYFRKVWKAQFNGVCSTDIWVIRAQSGYSQDFLFYYVANPEFVNLASGASGGTKMPRADWGYLSNNTCLLPPLSEQRAIAAVLSSLDDKIELLRAQNKTLENIAQALFKRWFVGFEFPDKNGKPYKSSGGKMIDSELGKIPEGWRVGRLTEIFDFLEGPGIRNWQYTETGRKFINIRLIQDGDIEIEHASHISSEEAERTYKHFHLQERDMVVSTSGTLGRSAIVRKEHLPLMLNTSVIRFRPIDKLSYGFMYQFLNSPFFKNELISMASGSVQSNFGPIHLKQIEMIIPGTTILKMYAIAANSLYDKINANLSHVKILSCFRDTILPKLMKGEVRVREHD